MGRAHDARRCAKGPAAEADRDASQHAVGGIAGVFFFSSYLFINSSFCFYCCVSTSGLNTTRPTFFSSWKRPGERLLPYFCSEKRLGYVANVPGGATSELFYGMPRGASFTPFFTVYTYKISKSIMAG